MKIEIEIGDEMEEIVVTRALKWHYECLNNDNIHLEEDRKYNNKLRKHIDGVLQAWLSPDEYVEWKNER